MNYQQPGYANNFAYHDDDTDPFMTSVLPSATGPLPAFSVVLPQKTRAERFTHRLGQALIWTVNKINRLLALALTVVLLLLVGRFLLIFFALTHSVFSHWMFLITSPLMYPFANLAPTLTVNGYIVDISTLVGMAVYIAAVLIVRKFLRILVTRE